MVDNLTRRGFLAAGTWPEASGLPKPDLGDARHVSSAVVGVRPEDCDAVATRLEALPGIEVRYVAQGKIVIVMEGPDAGALGARLAEIALMEHVLSANMVYEAAYPVCGSADSSGPEGGLG